MQNKKSKIGQSKIVPTPEHIDIGTSDTSGDDRISNLPPELLELVLQYTTNFEAIRLRRCSKTWKDIVDSYANDFWQPTGAVLFFADIVRWSVCDDVYCLRSSTTTCSLPMPKNTTGSCTARLFSQMQGMFIINRDDDYELCREMMMKLRPKELSIQVWEDSSNIQKMEKLMNSGDDFFYSGIRKITICNSPSFDMDTSFLDRCHSATELHFRSPDGRIDEILTKCPTLTHFWLLRAQLRSIADTMNTTGGVIKHVKSIFPNECPEVIYFIENGPFKKSAATDPYDVHLDLWLHGYDAVQHWIEENCSKVKSMRSVYDIAIFFVHRDIRFRLQINGCRMFVEGDYY